MRTVLALVAATAMIVGALYVRGEVGPGGGVGALANDEPARLVCVEELASVCEEIAQADNDIEVTVEEAGVTAERLTGPETPAHDAWLTIAPWPQIVSEARQREVQLPLPADGGDTVYARSPLVTSVWTERAAVLQRRCQGSITWRCIARHAGTPWSEIGGEAQWGQLRPGYQSPAESATGLLVLGQIASDLLGKTTFSNRDFEDDTFLRLLTDLEEAVPDRGSGGNTPLQQQLQFGPGKFDIVGTTEAEAAPLIERSPRAAALELRYPETVVVAEVVLAPLGSGDGSDRLRELVEESGSAALARAGWRVEGESGAAGAPTEPALPPESNLPPAGVLDALRGLWGEIAR